MRQLTTSGIVISRTNFGEADRILTVLTRDFGKVRLMAKGVRRARAKLAGSVELFSISSITFIKGRGDISTLTSARLERHFANIVKKMDRVSAGYELLKLTDKNTLDEVESGYYDLLAAALAALDDASVPLAVTKLYFEANLLVLAGHAPNLKNDDSGKPLAAAGKYNFDASVASFVASASGQYASDQIKFLRIAFSGNSPKALARIDAAELLANTSQPLVTAMLKTYLRT